MTAQRWEAVYEDIISNNMSNACDGDYGRWVFGLR